MMAIKMLQGYDVADHRSSGSGKRRCRKMVAGANKAIVRIKMLRKHVNRIFNLGCREKSCHYLKNYLFSVV